jgi:CubicO group peptidase (beta-lactamase class C family)
LVFAQQTKKDKRKQNQPLSSSIYLDSLDTEIQQDVATKDIVGATYLIYKKGTIVQKKAFGEANMLSHRAMKTDDIFRLASMTKPIASLALLLLQEDGLINMNDQLDQYLPAFKNPIVVDKIDTINGSAVLTTHPAKKPILLRHLLTHTAGFASQYGGNLGALYLGTFTNIYAHDLDYYANQVASLPLSHEPGDGWVYGPSINVAARVVEAVSGMSFQDFLQKRIFDPLQMKDTRFYYDISYADRITSHHTKTAEGQIKVEDPGDASSKLIAGPKVYYSGSGGLNSTLDDYIKFCVMVLNNGSHEGKMIAKPETIAMMKTDQVPLNINAILASQPSSFNEGFTFGYQIQRKNDNPSRTLGTISWLGATGPTFFIDPKNEVIGIYLTQMQPYSNIKSRKNFANWVLKATK